MQSVIYSQQFQDSQVFQNLESIVASSASLSFVISVEKILSIDVRNKNDDDEKHTQFLNTMIDLNKTFRISCFVIKSFDETIELNKQYTQVDQKSDMNVIFMNLIKRLELHLHDLVEIEFRELFMKIANNNDIILQH